MEADGERFCTRETERWMAHSVAQMIGINVLCSRPQNISISSQVGYRKRKFIVYSSERWVSSSPSDIVLPAATIAFHNQRTSGGGIPKCLRNIRSVTWKTWRCNNAAASCINKSILQGAPRAPPACRHAKRRPRLLGVTDGNQWHNQCHKQPDSVSGCFRDWFQIQFRASPRNFSALAYIS